MTGKLTLGHPLFPALSADDLPCFQLNHSCPLFLLPARKYGILFSGIFLTGRVDPDIFILV